MTTNTIIVVLLALFAMEASSQFINHSKRDLYTTAYSNSQCVTWINSSDKKYWNYDEVCWSKSESVSEWNEDPDYYLFSCSTDSKLSGSSKYLLWSFNYDKWGDHQYFTEYVSLHFSSSY